MTKRWIPRAGAVCGMVVATAFVVAACGGDDDASPATGDDETTSVEADSGEAPIESGASTTSAAPTDDSASGDSGERGDSGGDETSGDDDGAGDEGGTGGDVTCDQMFSIDEVEEWFGEPATVTSETNDSLGQTTCTWGTIEDSADVDDLTASGITAQFFSGDPIPAASFVDASIFDEVREIDGVADVAFAVDEFGMDYYFVDGDVAGSLSLFTIDMSGDSPDRHTTEEADQMFATFVERVTG